MARLEDQAHVYDKFVLYIHIYIHTHTRGLSDDVGIPELWGKKDVSSVFTVNVCCRGLMFSFFLPHCCNYSRVYIGCDMEN